MAIAKGALALGALVAVTVPAACIASSVAAENIKTISEVQDEKYEGKLGNYFVDLFLAATGDHNSATWNKKFEAFKNSSATPATSGFFNSLTNNNKTLDKFKEACKTAYKEDTPTSLSTDADKWKEVWKHCSIVDEQPVTVGSITDANNEEKKNVDTNGKWNGKVGANKKENLVSITSNKNKAFWERRNQKSVDAADKYFTSLKSKNNTIQKSCESAYALDATATSTSEESKPTEEELLKYCGLTKKSS